MGDRLKRERGYLWHVLGIVYTIFMICFGFSTVLYFTLTREGGDTVVYYESIYSGLYISGSCTLIAFFVYIRRWRYCYFTKVATSKSKNTSSNHGIEVTKNEDGKKSQELPYYCFNGEGFNSYLRCGLFLFLVGSVTYNVLRFIGEVFHLHDCYSSGRVSFSMLQAIFFILQCIFICLYHKIVFFKFKTLVRFGLMNLFITNICTWAHTAIGEIVEEVESDRHKINIKNNGTHYDQYSSKDPCLLDRYTDAARPFLTPAIIEFALLAAPMMLEILMRVGRTEFLNVNQKEKEEEEGGGGGGGGGGRDDDGESAQFSHLHKSHRGLFFSLALLVASVAVLIILYLLKDSFLSTLVYYVIDIVLTSSGLFICFVCAIQMRKLKFGKFEKDSFNDKILLLCLIGLYVYCGITSMSCLDLLRNGDLFSQRGKILIILKLVGKLVSLLQASLQSVVLLDGLRRRVSHDDHVVRKPGRPYVLALLGINLALWVFDTFEVRKADILIKNEVKVSGQLNIVSWSSLLHTALPMVIFFRYHSTALLSIIWHKVYSKEE